MNQLRLLGISTIFFLTACAPKPHELNEMQPIEKKSATPSEPSKNDEKTETTKSTNNKLTAFELNGAIAAKNHKKGWTATVNWTQSSSNHYQIRLIGPLGGQTIMIASQGNNVTYQEGAKKISSANGTDLLQKQTGIRLPVSNLYYWVRGIKAPGTVTAEKHNKNGELELLKQGGYTITYGQYTNAFGNQLPSKIRLDGHDVMIKLIIKNWSKA